MWFIMFISTMSNPPDNHDTVSNESLVKVLRGEIKLNSPVLFTAFPGAGFVGSICANYIISKFRMVQIGCMESKYIVPGVICAKGDLKHPFPLYSNDEGDICIFACEAPVIMEGVHSVLDTIVKWALDNKIKEIIVFDGIPVEGSPVSRMPIVFSRVESIDDNKGRTTKKEQKEKDNTVTTTTTTTTVYPPTSFIAGISGGIISYCISNNITSKAFLIPAPRGKPDLEGAAILLESLGKITENKKLRLDTSQLRKEAEDLRRKYNIPGRDNLWLGSSVLNNQLQPQIWYY
jgi:uncharacterized protein